jgi:aerobic carbon-monoxide dehydrogenase large subunit
MMSGMGMTGTTRSVGTAALRVEDPRMLTGRGRYVDDVSLSGMLHAAFLRSPFPHANINSVDVSAARKLPGVAAVFTGDDMQARTQPLRPGSAPAGYRYEPVFALSHGKVRFVGDPVAIVVADSRYIAEDACERIEVDYDPLPAIATYDQALANDAPLVFDSLGTNVVYEAECSYGDVETAFAQADHVVRETFVQHRIAQVPMEGRGGVAEYNPVTKEFTYHAGSQSPHLLRSCLCDALGLDLERTAVVNGDIGGAFGLKLFTHREDIAVAAAAQWVGRPVKWIEDRNENLVAAGQAREEKMEVEVAVSRDGIILATRGEILMDGGAYPGIPFPPGVFIPLMLNLFPGPYRMQAYAMRGKVLASNKCTYNSYRAPWAMETWVRERVLNLVARDLGLDPADIRRRNFFSGAEGDRMITGLSLAGITAAQSLERALLVADYAQLAEQREAARVEGRYLGIGFATCIEAAPGPSEGRAGRDERAKAVLAPNGHLIVYTTQAPSGHGHETTLSQIASDEMGIPMESVKVVHGDTRTTPFAMMGTGGSKAATMASGAVLHATRALKRKVLSLAAAMLEANIDDLDISGAAVHVAGVPAAQLTIKEIAREAHFAPHKLPAGEDLLLESTASYDGGLGGWSDSTHLCVVEADLQTGRISVLRYLVVEDCGRMVNPAIVEGQVCGGVAQGVGEVLYEHSAYDSEGNFQAGTLADYLIPTASEIPLIEIDHLESATNEEVSYRGVGEGGLLVAPAAITNAIEDALTPFGVTIREQYLPPSRILELVGVI